jgi:hypothetical protein
VIALQASFLAKIVSLVDISPVSRCLCGFIISYFLGCANPDLEHVCRSSAHGRGLSRFWSCVEGYKGPALILLSAFSNGGSENVDANQRWGIGVLTEQGFENKDTFYGSSGFLCTTYPIFRMLLPSGMTSVAYFLFFCHTSWYLICCLT